MSRANPFIGRNASGCAAAEEAAGGAATLVGPAEKFQPQDIYQQLARVTASTVFARSPRLQDFLRFIVVETLERPEKPVKEITIGLSIYQKGAMYDPRIDSAVRVEARRLRKLLTRYYDTEGRQDSLCIRIPAGGYVPMFEHRLGARVTGTSGVSPARESGASLLAVMPIQPLTPDSESSAFAAGLTEELIFAGRNIPGVRILSRVLTLGDDARASSCRELLEAGKFDLLLSGSVRSSGGRLRLILELSDAESCTRWSDRLDLPCSASIAQQEQIAAAAVSAMALGSQCLSEMTFAQATNKLSYLASASLTH